MLQKDISQAIIFYRKLLFLGLEGFEIKQKSKWNTDQRASLFLTHLRHLHGDFYFQLRCPNEHVLVLLLGNKPCN